MAQPWKTLSRFIASIGLVWIATVAVAALVEAPAARAAEGCAPGTKCLVVNEDGTPYTGSGTAYTAQCRGTFPDFVTPATMLPAGYKGPWFKLSQNYPIKMPPLGRDAPWLKIDFKDGVKGANAYLYALRNYSFDGMIAADFRPQFNKVRPWYHMPLMNYGPGRREPTHGLTEERPVTGPELGLKPGVTIHNFAVGFYNAPGGYTIGQVWHTATPNLRQSHFADGGMTFKILFSNATADDFSDPSTYMLTGAPAWTIMTDTGPMTVRLMQMDVASVDHRSPTGWIFGTFAFDKTAKDPSPWRRLRPVGLSWGNDHGYTPADQAAGKKLTENTISDQIPAYAAAHLGWAGRTNGPVDNPISGCTSCHGTAQFPVEAALAPFSAACTTDAQKMYWFRTFHGTQPFGAVDDATCLPEQSDPPPAPLDFSLQMQVSVQNVLQEMDHNPCAAPKAMPMAVMSVKIPAAFANAPRVHR